MKESPRPAYSKGVFVELAQKNGENFMEYYLLQFASISITLYTLTTAIATTSTHTATPPHIDNCIPITPLTTHIANRHPNNALARYANRQRYDLIPLTALSTTDNDRVHHTSINHINQSYTSNYPLDKPPADSRPKYTIKTWCIAESHNRKNKKSEDKKPCQTLKKSPRQP